MWPRALRLFGHNRCPPDSRSSRPPNEADAQNAQTGVVASLVAAWTSDAGPCRVRQGEFDLDGDTHADGLGWVSKVRHGDHLARCVGDLPRQVSGGRPTDMHVQLDEAGLSHEDGAGLSGTEHGPGDAWGSIGEHLRRYKATSYVLSFECTCDEHTCERHVYGGWPAPAVLADASWPVGGPRNSVRHAASLCAPSVEGAGGAGE